MGHFSDNENIAIIVKAFYEDLAAIQERVNIYNLVNHSKKSGERNAI